ncbi:hypothetical protein IFM89_028963 [Coptis chinensis]|uniref:Uncharacterized protein n=1 Tax=Coptis chinensis TaxID=261450 RepID=A0A835IGM9_9MAGN|nr:hypothetical protein IFM89_028963 [Coptis chinensis]
MPINKETTPPPVIGKAGRYTVFITPPTTPSPKPHFELNSESPKTPAPLKIVPPPQQFEKSTTFQSKSSSSTFAFFWNAVTKVQNAHSSLDGYLAEWFGLDHSKYQWALDDYYESKGMAEADIVFCFFYLAYNLRVRQDKKKVGLVELDHEAREAEALKIEGDKAGWGVGVTERGGNIQELIDNRREEVELENKRMVDYYEVSEEFDDLYDLEDEKLNLELSEEDNNRERAKRVEGVV